MYYLAEVFRTTSKAHSFLPRLARAFPTRAFQRGVNRKNSNNIRLPVSPTRSFKSRRISESKRRDDLQIQTSERSRVEDIGC